jgi:aryl-alcohol dehydrogenase-like predicted oxidoreductase
MFGMRVSQEESFALMDTYLEAGGNWIDTARVYCTDLIKKEELLGSYRDSEETIGLWIRSRNVRDQVTLITKGAHWNLADHTMRVKGDCIRSDIELSLKKTGLDHVDIYFLHNDDPSVPVEEIMPVLHELVLAGKTRAIGASNWKIGRIQEANRFARANSLTPFSISQVKWSYAAPTEKAIAGSVNMEKDPEEYRSYLEENIPVMAYSSQARGFFLKAAKNGLSESGVGSAAPFWSEENERRAKAVLSLAQKENISVAAAAFSYLWSRNIPVTALVGSASVSQLRESLENCDYLPSPESKALLEQARG